MLLAALAWAPRSTRAETGSRRLILAAATTGRSNASAAAPADDDTVYVNRAINLAGIEVLALDHDFTLARWNPHLWEGKIFEIAFGWLREQAPGQGIPPQVFAHWRYAPHTIRGLVVDKYTGHILKLDAQRLPVQIALGTTMLGPRRLQQVLEQVYGNQPLDVEQPSSRDSGRYLLVNSPFDMARVQLFQRLCDLRSRNVGALAKLSFKALYDLANAAVDYANGDAQRLKLEVLKDPSRYRQAGTETDRALEQATRLLQAWGQAGRTRALITNSSWPFVRAAMPAFYGDAWRDLFELVIVEAKKPDFFGAGRPFEQLASEGSASFDPVAADAQLRRDTIYRGGNVAALGRSLGLETHQMLYVGDDLGQDSAAPRRAGLYTVGVVPELGEDRSWAQEHRPLIERRSQLIDRLQELEHERGLSQQAKTLASRASSEAGSMILSGDTCDAHHAHHEQLRALTSALRAVDREIQQAWGPWGPPTHGVPGHPSLLAQHAFDHADILVPHAGALGRFTPTERVRRTTPYLGFTKR